MGWVDVEEHVNDKEESKCSSFSGYTLTQARLGDGFKLTYLLIRGGSIPAILHIERFQTYSWVLLFLKRQPKLVLEGGFAEIKNNLPSSHVASWRQYLGIGYLLRGLRRECKSLKLEELT